MGEPCERSFQVIMYFIGIPHYLELKSRHGLVSNDSVARLGFPDKATPGTIGPSHRPANAAYPADEVIEVCARYRLMALCCH
jgi:hypothetical protein